MRVMVVDDSRMACRQLSQVVRGLGHEVVGQANDGAEAVKIFQQTRPQLILLDLIMPGMDGISVLRAIRSVDRDVRVIVVSSVGGVGNHAAEALRLDASAVISKPFDASEVAKAIAQSAAE